MHLEITENTCHCRILVDSQFASKTTIQNKAISKIYNLKYSLTRLNLTLVFKTNILVLSVRNLFLRWGILQKMLKNPEYYMAVTCNGPV